ncbi:TRET1 [Lepeophtheirus salmonis]|uniref:TRET1 n=1 Tax=Lepeophtheirus salmonis TaxID=72036 RepID=A0A7R8H7L2_LEPSM|nr:TRET1 [Lepeophtheirus salmonis]CAF2923019.1 TRET1 [Lepeophtheirus salmonis]
MGEIFPARIRGPAASLSTAFNWTCTFVVTKTFMDLQIVLGQSGVFWLFAGILIISCFFVIFFVPETRGKTLEDIERLYIERRMSIIMDGGDAPPPIQSYRRVSSIANLKSTPSQFFIN